MQELHMVNYVDCLTRCCTACRATALLLQPALPRCLLRASSRLQPARQLQQLLLLQLLLPQPLKQ
jgi:hypothetical protein